MRARVSKPLVTIVVVTHNSRRWLARQRIALEAQTETRWRLAVVDNASTPDQRPRLCDLPVNASLVQSRVNLGFAAANNLAALDARTPFLAFLNPDAFPEPNWLAELLTLAQRFPGAGAIGSTQTRADAPGVLDGTGDVLHASGLAYRSSYGKRGAAPQDTRESFSACAAAMLVRRDAFESVAGFDERYFCYFEDVDLCFRLRLGGWRVLQAARAGAAHVGGGSAGRRSPFADFHGARNRTWTFVKCMPAALFWPLAPLHLAACALACTIAAMRGRGFAAWRGFLAGVAAVPSIWRARVATQRHRTASAWDIAATLAWSPDTLVTRRPVLRRWRAAPQPGERALP